MNAELDPIPLLLLSRHADFTNGWPSETNSTFQQAIDTCGLETGGDIDACAVFAPYIDYDQASACQIEGDIVNESVGWKDPIKKLPGNVSFVLLKVERSISH